MVLYRFRLDMCPYSFMTDLHMSLWWRHNEHDSVSNHQPHDCLLNRLFTRRSKKTSKLRVTGLCAGNSPETGEFPAQRASNAENGSIWWRHHVLGLCVLCLCWRWAWQRNLCCRIWSWSPVPCEKHGPRDSVDKNRGRRPRFLSLLRPEGHVFHTAWETMIKCNYSTLADWLFSMFYSHKYEF